MKKCCVGIGVVLFSFALNTPVNAQLTSAAVTPTIGQWRSAGSDGKQLTALVDATIVQSVSGLKILLTVARDSSFHLEARLHALWGLEPFLGGFRCNDAEYPFDGHDARCYVDGWTMGAERFRLAALTKTTVDPIWRDSIRATLATLQHERGAISVAATAVREGHPEPESSSDSLASMCHRLFASMPLLLGSKGLIQWEAGGLFLSGSTLGSLPNRCNLTAPPILAQLWQRVADDSSTLSRLVDWTEAIRDQRLYDVALAVARDKARPERIRLKALDVFVGEIHGGMVRSDIRMYKGPEQQPFACNMSLGEPALTQENGEKALPPGVFQRGRATLNDFAAKETNAVLRARAIELQACFDKLLVRLPTPARSSLPPAQTPATTSGT